ncbi:MAG: ABC transporter permease [Candidatus Omnitrophica bacterium]|nr:ABC transporter permease [Candidatus Omnitrophota bacterium]
MFRKINALIKKDFLIESSYKLAFIMNIFSVCASLLIYFFINRLFGNKINAYLEEFGVNYFSYVLLSMAFFSYIGVGIGSFSSRIRLEQLQGTLESLFLTPTKTETIILSMAIWNIVFATLDVLIYFLFGVFLFKINFTNINFLSAFTTLILTIISFSSLGIFSASFVLIYKRGNPTAWLISTLEGVVGGVYFPINVLPGYLQMVAHCLPVTYAIRAIELAVYQNYSVYQLKNELLFLLIFSIILLPLSLKTFKKAIRTACRQGSLTQY